MNNITMNNSTTITLVNGPYGGRVIEDLGATRIRMSISTDGENKGATIGEAHYEPNEARTLAFFSHNTWLGTLEGVVLP